MNRMIIAAVAAIATIGSTGIASAQQAPQLIGNYSASVLDEHNGANTQNGADFVFSSSAAITSRAVDGDNFNGPVNLTDQNYSR